MPITKSAIKAMKQSRKANERNKGVKVDFKVKTKAVKKDVVDGAKNLGKLTSMAIQSLDKASKSGVIHKRTAARKKSRLMKSLSKATGNITELISIKDPIKTATKKTATKNTDSKKSTKTAKKVTKKEA